MVLAFLFVLAIMQWLYLDSISYIRDTLSERVSMQDGYSGATEHRCSAQGWRQSKFNDMMMEVPKMLLTTTLTLRGLQCRLAHVERCLTALCHLAHTSSSLNSSIFLRPRPFASSLLSIIILSLSRLPLWKLGHRDLVFFFCSSKIFLSTISLAVMSCNSVTSVLTQRTSSQRTLWKDTRQNRQEARLNWISH